MIEALNISGYLPPAYLAVRIDPSTGKVLTGAETLVRLDNGSYVLSDLDNATLRSELTNDGLEIRMPPISDDITF